MKSTKTIKLLFATLAIAGSAYSPVTHSMNSLLTNLFMPVAVSYVPSIIVYESFYRYVIPAIKQKFYPQEQMLALLKDEVNKNLREPYTYWKSSNLLIKQDYIEENFANINHDFLNILSPENKDKTLSLLLEYEHQLDTLFATEQFEKDGITKKCEYKKQIAVAEKLQRKLTVTIEEIKQDVKKSPKLLDYIPEAMTAFTLATSAYLLYRTEVFQPLIAAFKSFINLCCEVSQDKYTYASSLTAQIDGEGNIIPDLNGPIVLRNLWIKGQLKTSNHRTV